MSRRKGKILRFDHVTLQIRDVARSLDFYSKMMGLRVASGIFKLFNLGGTRSAQSRPARPRHVVKPHNPAVTGVRHVDRACPINEDPAGVVEAY